MHFLFPCKEEVKQRENNSYKQFAYLKATPKVQPEIRASPAQLPIRISLYIHFLLQKELTPIS